MYLLFAGDNYYPQGGARDLVGSYRSVDDAVKAHDPKRNRYDGGWANILDTRTLEIVKCFSRGTWANSYLELNW